jgi:hypothetical protein
MHNPGVQKNPYMGFLGFLMKMTFSHKKENPPVGFLFFLPVFR